MIMYSDVFISVTIILPLIFIPIAARGAAREVGKPVTMRHVGRTAKKRHRDVTAVLSLSFGHDG